MLLIYMSMCLTAHGHHFKGMPHFSYFENYPQVPQEEFLAQVEKFEMSLVIYDFQGIQKIDAEQPDNVRFYLAIFNLLENRTYQGPLTLTLLDGDTPVLTRKFDHSEEESLYSFQKALPDKGDFSLRVVLHETTDANATALGEATIPFTLSSQRFSWGPWVAGFLIVLITVAAIGSRRARVAMDRKENARLEKQQAALTSPPDHTPDASHETTPEPVTTEADPS
ncbi:MAG: hypothetical protein ACYTGQ_08980 [Planctomycetota bacterium]